MQEQIIEQETNARNLRAELKGKTYDQQNLQKAETEAEKWKERQKNLEILLLFH